MSDVEIKTDKPEPQTVPKPVRQIAKLAEALAKAQGEFVQPEKNKEVEVRKEGRVLYATRYADLKNVIEAFRVALSRNGLAFTQKTRETPNGWRLVLTLMHSSGEFDETSMPINLEQAPQQVGSQLTYLKRYQAAAYFGIAADDDDDANGAHGNESEFKDQKAKPKNQPNPQATGSKPITPAVKPEPKPAIKPKSEPHRSEHSPDLSEVARDSMDSNANVEQRPAARPTLTVQDVAKMGAKKGWHAQLMNRFMVVQFGKSNAASLTQDELHSMAESIQTMNGFDATTFIEQLEKSKA